MKTPQIPALPGMTPLKRRIQVVCPDPRTPVYVALVDGKDVGAYSSYLDAEKAAESYLRQP